MDAQPTGNGGVLTGPVVSLFRPWRELATLSAIGMEMSWAVLWYRLFVISRLEISYGRAFSILLLLFLLTYLTTRVGRAFNLKVNILRGISLALLLVNLLLGLRVIVFSGESMSLAKLVLQPLKKFSGSLEMIPAEFVIMLIVILVWWRGISFAQKRVGPITVLGGFRTGVIFFFAYGLLSPMLGGMPVMALYIFIFFSLLALTSARISIVKYLRGGQQIPFDKVWFLGIILVILLMVSLSALAVGIVSGDMLVFLTDVFAFLLYILTIILAPFIWLFLRIAFFLGELLPIQALLNLLLDALGEVQSVLQGLIGSIGDLFGSISFPPLESLVRFLAKLKPLALWGLILATVIIALATLRAALGREERGSRDTQDSTIESADLLDLLRRLLSGNLRELSSRLGAVLGIGNAERLLAAERIRRIYGEMMDMCSQMGHPRPASRTPLEFLPNLNDLFPHRSDELSTITHAYLRVRYGDLSESRYEVDAVEQAWGQIKSEGKELFDSRKKK
jgi:hypothetical protein